ncbi:MAG: magnesium transporter [Candidatus Nealsonbacteria bacterium]
MLEKLRKLIQKKGWKEMGEIGIKFPPHDFSLVLEETQKGTRNKILSQLSFKMLVKLLPELSEEVKGGFIGSLTSQKAAELLSKIPSDEIVDILQNIPVKKRTEILREFSKEKIEEVTFLLKYPPKTAGGLMTTEFIALNEEISVQETIRYIREKAKDHPVYHVYIVDDKRRLVGVLSLRQLILANPKEKLKYIMQAEVIKVLPKTDQERAANLITDYNLLALPVVDKEDKILGIVTADDAMEVMEEEASEDIALMSGTTPVDSLVGVPANLMVKARLPWLIIGLMGGIVAAWIVGFFEHTLSSYITLAMFMPVLVYMSDAMGTQSETITIRAMALEPKFRIKKYFLRELKIGFAIAIICGTIISLAVALGWGPPLFGLIIGISMFLGILVVTFFATSLPFLLKKLNIDPALAAGPFATIISDIVTLVIYFSVASLMMRYFL